MDYWIIDFGVVRSQESAAQYEAPYGWVEQRVRPIRRGKREARANEMWWIYYWPRPEMRVALEHVSSYLATPSVAKHQIFRRLDARVMPDGALVVLCREDNTFYGLVESSYHQLWARRTGSTLEDRPAYTPSTAFEAFPFPKGLTPNIAAAGYAADPRAQAIAEAAAELDGLREEWLNPPDLVRVEPEVVPG